MFMYFYCFVYVFLLFCLCVLIVVFMYSYCFYVFLLLCLCILAIFMYSYCFVCVLIVVFMYSYCYIYVFLLFCLCVLIVMFMYSYYVYEFLLLCTFRSEYSVTLCSSVFCLCVNVYCTAATGCQPNCSEQIYHKYENCVISMVSESVVKPCSVTASPAFNDLSFIRIAKSDTSTVVCVCPLALLIACPTIAAAYRYE